MFIQRAIQSLSTICLIFISNLCAAADSLSAAAGVGTTDFSDLNTTFMSQITAINSFWWLIALALIVALGISVLFLTRSKRISNKQTFLALINFTNSGSTMRLSTKMFTLVVTMIAMMTMISVMAYFNMNKMSMALSKIGEVDIPVSNAIAKISTSQLRQSIWLERGLLAAEIEDKPTLKTAVTAFDSLTTQIDDGIQSTNSAIISMIENTDVKQTKIELETLQGKMQTIENSYESFYSKSDDLLLLMQEGEIAKAELQLRSVQRESEQLSQNLDDLAQEYSGKTQVATKQAKQNASAALLTMSVIALIAIMISIVIGFFIARSILRQLGADPAELADISERLASGRLNVISDDSATGVHASINQTVDNLKEVISNIKASANEVGIATQQVSQGNTDLSQRTQEQASSLEKVASSMEEMTGTVNQNAENAMQASQLGLAAQKQASEGGQVVDKAVTAMNEINTSNKQIADIIGVVDEIAFQTNLLALNAAVEAARAGEQGRGFAVVANEVRNLAGKSATAAKEIKALVKDSVDKVDEGSKLVDESGSALEEIVMSVKKVSDIVAEIAAASLEQSDGIGQVNKAILQLDEMTQQNASLVEEAAAASEMMGVQAQELTSLVAYFKMEDDGLSNIPMQQVSQAAANIESVGVEPDKQVNQVPRKGLPQVQAEDISDDSDWKEF